ncbi:alanine racemase C-terminal domain-containing protein [Gardnerella vaginalis]|uniref:alanine racemase C-terminal domain-containing protein n=1 Tax=Gardnerella vaginalis TaxID=2702 RepID=UPI0038BC68DF
MGVPQTYDLRPAMTLQAQLGTVKSVEAGHGISYGRTYLTPDNTSTAIVPLGYADGICAPLADTICKDLGMLISLEDQCA